MSHEIKTDSFTFSCDLHTFDDEELPVSAILDVFVDSYGFCGRASLDVDIKSFVEFTSDLLELYNSLNWHARLEETYGFHQYIEFRSDRRGHIYVYGRINSCGKNGYDQELRFENKFDQTYLKDFSKALYDAYGKV